MKPLKKTGGSDVPGHFMGTRTSLERSKFVVLLLPYERTTSYRKGTVNGPKHFVEGSLGVERWDEEVRRQTYRDGIHTTTLPPRGQGPRQYFPRIRHELERLITLKKTVFCIGGEHSLSQATIPPFIKRWPDLSVLHFDAHADLRPSYRGSRHSHACSMYPISKRCRIVQVGIRSVGEEEAHFVNSGRVRTFLMREQYDVRTLIPEVLRTLSDNVFISIDLDGFDPAVIPGVGTPQPGGFSWQDALALFRAVAATKNVFGVDIMELCPFKDDVISELAAAKLAYRLMGFLAR